MITSRKRCEFEIHNSFLTLDFKHGGFTRVDFQDITEVQSEVESNVSIGNKLFLSIIISVVFVIVDYNFPNWYHSGGWASLSHSVFVTFTTITLLILLFHLKAALEDGIKKWDNIIIAARGRKNIVFSVDRGKGKDVVLEIRSKMRN